MLLLSILITLIVLVGSLHIAYRKTRDALHPLILLVPLLSYVYVFRPLAFALDDNILRFFRSESQLLTAQFIQILGLSGFCFGVLHGTPRTLGYPRFIDSAVIGSNRRLMIFASVLGGIGVLSFVLGLMASGGFSNAYSEAKGGGYSSSGYVRELPHLSIAAVAILFMAKRGRKFTPVDWGLLTFFAVPFLLHGTIGSRRGPLFMVLTSIYFSFMLFSSRRPSLAKVLPLVFVVGLAVLFVFAQRSKLHLNSDMDLNFNDVVNTMTLANEMETKNVNSSSTWLISTATVAAVNSTGECNYGRRWLVVLFIRPIPRQIWPDKYEDVGFGWMGDKESYHGIYDSTWIRAIGWIPPAGSSISFVADAYFELSYFYLVFLYLVGRMFALFWLRARFIGKGWSVLYVVVASISIFLAAQDVPAFFFRLLFVSALTLAIAWFLRVPFSLRVQRDEQDSYVSHR